MSAPDKTSEVMRAPELGEAGVEGVVAVILVQPGQSVEVGQTLLEVETDKVVLEVPSVFDGIVDEWLVECGGRIQQGTEIARITPQDRGEDAVAADKPDRDEEPVTEDEPAAPEPVTQAPDRDKEDKSAEPPRTQVAAGPATRRLARELGVPLWAVPGTGVHGRISKSDLKTHVRLRIGESSNGLDGTAGSLRSMPGDEVLGPNTRKSMTGIQTATSRNMRHSAARVPHAWIQEKIDITELESGRKQLKASIANEGGSLTLTALLCKCLCHAIREFPIFNAVLDDERDEVVYRHEINLGVAVDTPRGLVVPVLKNVGDASLKDISIGLADVSEKARNARLRAADLRGASFTISNLGGIGTSGIFPIINWPEVAILGVGAGEWTPSYCNGDRTQAPQPRLVLPVTLAFDHRLINGADGARFLQRVKDILERPLPLFCGYLSRSVTDHVAPSRK